MNTKKIILSKIILKYIYIYICKRLIFNLREREWYLIINKNLFVFSRVKICQELFINLICNSVIILWWEVPLYLIPSMHPYDCHGNDKGRGSISWNHFNNSYTNRVYNSLIGYFLSPKRGSSIHWNVSLSNNPILPLPNFPHRNTFWAQERAIHSAPA